MMVMNDEFVRIAKEAVVVYLKVSRHSPEEVQESHTDAKQPRTIPTSSLERYLYTICSICSAKLGSKRNRKGCKLCLKNAGRRKRNAHTM
jgi:hypothetical protein